MASGQEVGSQNRRLAAYALKCLGTIYLAAYAAALQSVFEIRNPPSRQFFLKQILILSIIPVLRYGLRYNSSRFLFEEDKLGLLLQSLLLLLQSRR